jgi:hypothetical protein
MVDYETIKSIIKKEILETIEGDKEFGVDNKKNKDNKILCFIPSYITQAKVVEAIKKDNEGCHIDYAAFKDSYNGKFGIDEVLDISDSNIRMEIANQIDGYKKVVLINPTLAFFKSVVEWDDKCFIATMTFESLIRGIKTHAYMSFDEKEILRTKAFMKTRDMINEIKEMGLKMVFRSEKSIGNANDLITEEDITFALKNNIKQVVLSKDGIITPLAKDTAREKNIDITMERV